ncbi:ribonuclease H-like domain-containing protein [Russula earlei]|uniref:Ribonuclease H-like domain-containing protein n=1 Tax=Russula earlei TaxID=71964 RepID=A0ACC0UCB2_9AGAM|nr:ribonuclease H-like domain-containing protein [Russula earlei]
MSCIKPSSAILRPEPAPGVESRLSINHQYRAVRVPQPYDAFLVLDVEATCLPGTDFDWPNEIIEWPVCLLRWVDKEEGTGMAGTLHKVAEFRSFVKPTWRPQLSAFCVSLTGITQEQVDGAPHFPEVVSQFSDFLTQHGLIHRETGEHGPFDVRDFVVKQCFISKISMPSWIRGDVMDVRAEVRALPRRISPNIEHQLRFLDLAPFEGRQHSGIDDSRNIARIVVDLARRGVRLVPNTPIQPGRRWPWMGRSGRILEQYC